MSSDSQPIELVDGGCRVLGHPGRDSPISIRQAGGFSGLIGYVGRPQIGGLPTRAWQERASRQRPDLSLGDFCNELADDLSREWARNRLKSGLWIFLSGIEAGEPRFWFVNNIGKMAPGGLGYTDIGQAFYAVNDLDLNYIRPRLGSGITKTDVLERQMFMFRNGVLLPAAFVFDAFRQVMEPIYAQGLRGFSPIQSLTDLAYFDRQRMEFLKRLHSPKHGIATAARPAIAGAVHVRGVELDGSIWNFPKIRHQRSPL